MIDFKKRLITGLVLATIVISVIIFLPFQAFLILSSAMILFAAWEWALLMSLKQYRWVYVLLIGLLMIIAQKTQIPLIYILWSSLIWWLIAFILVATYPKSDFLWASSYLITGIMGILVLIPCWLSLNTIRQLDNGIILLFVMLFIIWGADIGAYCVGQLPWKKRHYCLPYVSPKKTYEGLLGGLVFSLFIGTCFGFFLLKENSLLSWVLLLLLILTTALFSVIGDLFKSMFKRKLGIKDIGNYLPGHGGLLDRIDSITSAAPIFLLGLLLLHQYYAFSL